VVGREQHVRPGRRASCSGSDPVAPERFGWVFGCLGLLAVAVLAGPAPADPVRLAYLDPGSGSFLIQALVALVAGIAVALRTYWEKVKSLLGLSRGAGGGSGGDTPGDDG